MSNELDSRGLRKLFETTSIGELPIKPCPILRPDQSAGEAATAMREHNRGGVLICDQGRVVGIFTERDWLRLLDQGTDSSTPLAQVMTASPGTLTTQNPVADAVAMMDRGRYRRVAVLDADGAPKGLIDVKTIVHFIVEHIPESVYTQASHAQMTAKEPEGA